MNNNTNPVMRENAPYFWVMSLIYSLCFAIAFYKNFIGITYPCITAITVGVCILFLRKNGISWKKSNWWYVTGILLLGISTSFTTNGFVIFFNTIGTLLLITVFMMRQFYDDENWNLGQYLCNLLFLYICMIPEVASPFIHFVDYRKHYNKEEKKNTSKKYVLIGILIGLPMVLIVIELLSSADQIFSEMIGSSFHELMSQVIFSPNLFLVIVLLIMGFFGIYCFLSSLTLNNMPNWKQKQNKKNPIIAITFISMIVVVYLIFCGIQMIFLFSGGLLLPEGYTYAEYAHQGFYQLLFVCIFNLILVITCLAVFQMNKILKTLLLIFSGCTYIMIASSTCRMLLYIATYHLTFLRVLVLWFLAMLVFLMAGVVASILKENFKLFSYCTTVVMICYLIFSFGKVDYLVASYNVAHMGEDISSEDVRYLTNLSMEASLALEQYSFEHEHYEEYGENEVDYELEYEDDTDTVYRAHYKDKSDESIEYDPDCRKCILDRRFQEILDDTDDMGVRTFNFSKFFARNAAKRYFE